MSKSSPSTVKFRIHPSSSLCVTYEQKQSDEMVQESTSSVNTNISRSRSVSVTSNLNLPIQSFNASSIVERCPDIFASDIKFPFTCLLGHGNGRTESP